MIFVLDCNIVRSSEIMNVDAYVVKQALVVRQALVFGISSDHKTINERRFIEKPRIAIVPRDLALSSAP